MPNNPFVFNYYSIFPAVFEPTLPGAGAEPEMPPANLFESKIVTSNENGSVGPKLSEEGMFLISPFHVKYPLWQNLANLCIFIGSTDQKTHDLLNTRRNQYKTAAVQAKHSGDESSARKYYKTAKVSIILHVLYHGHASLFLTRGISFLSSNLMW